MSKTQLRGQAAPTAPAEGLKRFATDVFARVGLPKSDAAVVADVLVWANLRGVDTHGVMRIPRYVDLVETGDMNPRPEIVVRTETPASVLIEADRAAGPVAMMRAMAEALRKARDAGVGLALVRATTHTAALGYYTLAAAREGMAAIALAASWPNVVYHGTRAAGVSTSPISIAVPGPEPVVLDMATSVVSMGKLNQAKRTGGPVSPDRMHHEPRRGQPAARRVAGRHPRRAPAPPKWLRHGDRPGAVRRSRKFPARSRPLGESPEIPACRSGGRGNSHAR